MLAGDQWLGMDVAALNAYLRIREVANHIISFAVRSPLFHNPWLGMEAEAELRGTSTPLIRQVNRVCLQEDSFVVFI